MLPSLSDKQEHHESKRTLFLVPSEQLFDET